LFAHLLGYLNSPLDVLALRGFVHVLVIDPPIPVSEREFFSPRCRRSQNGSQSRRRMRGAAAAAAAATTAGSEPSFKKK